MFADEDDVAVLERDIGDAALEDVLHVDHLRLRLVDAAADEKHLRLEGRVGEAAGLGDGPGEGEFHRHLAAARLAHLADHVDLVLEARGDIDVIVGLEIGVLAEVALIVKAGEVDVQLLALAGDEGTFEVGEFEGRASHRADLDALGERDALEHGDGTVEDDAAGFLDSADDDEFVAGFALRAATPKSRSKNGPFVLQLCIALVCGSGVISRR